MPDETDLVRAYRETHFHVDGPAPFVLRVGEPSPPLAALHAEHGTPSSVYLTAENPASRPTDDAENAVRRAALARELGARGLRSWPGRGRHPTSGWPPEESVLVLGLGREEAREIGARFGQNAVLWMGADAVPELVWCAGASTEHHGAERRGDVRLTLVMLAILITPAWFTPAWISLPWQIAVVLGGIPAVLATWQHAPWMPTPRAEADRVIRHLGLRPGKRFCDLGAGDGRMVVRVHRATGADCTGIERTPLLLLAAWVRLALQGGRGARVVPGDLYRADLSRYDTVYVWGTAYSVGTERFGARMREALAPGARLVSYHQPVAGWEPAEVYMGGQRPIYVYLLTPGRTAPDGPSPTGNDSDGTPRGGTR